MPPYYSKLLLGHHQKPGGGLVSRSWYKRRCGSKSLFWGRVGGRYEKPRLKSRLKRWFRCLWKYIDGLGSIARAARENAMSYFAHHYLRLLFKPQILSVAIFGIGTPTSIIMRRCDQANKFTSGRITKTTLWSPLTLLKNLTQNVFQSTYFFQSTN